MFYIFMRYLWKIDSRNQDKCKNVKIKTYLLNYKTK